MTSRPKIKFKTVNEILQIDDEEVDKESGQIIEGSRHSQQVGTKLPKYSELKDHFETLKNL